MGDDGSHIVIRIGDIAIKMHDSIGRPIRNVRYVPNRKINLISLRILEDEGHFFKFDNQVLKIIKGSLIIMK